MHLDLTTEAETHAFGQRLAARMAPGDCLCLHGTLGAGKSSLARAMIRHWLGAGTEVPSPTYTIVNVYEGDCQIWHADLYRIGAPEETGELGLFDEPGTRILLIEWPDRAGDFLPARRLELRIDFLPDAGDEARRLTLDAIGGGWDGLEETL